MSHRPDDDEMQEMLRFIERLPLGKDPESFSPISSEEMQRVWDHFDVDGKSIWKVGMAATESVMGQIKLVAEVPPFRAYMAEKIGVSEEDFAGRFLASTICSACTQMFMAGMEYARRFTFPALMEEMNKAIDEVTKGGE